VSGEEIFGFIMMFGCCFGCGAMIFGIGLWAERSKKPFGFWTFREVKRESISDIPAYNRESGKLWKLYSVPFFLAGALYSAGIRFPALQMAAIILLVIACTVGIALLIWQYKRIERKYRR
jgi:hypothetical protein